MTIGERFRLRQALIGLAMLPVSVLPFAVYLGHTQEGGVLMAKVSSAVDPPQVHPLEGSELERVSEHAPSYTGRVALLVYHGLGSGETAGHSEGFTVAPERFAEQLAALDAAGFNFVTARDVALAFAGKRELPHNAVMISFDDGRTDAMLYADPVLRQLDARATMFVIAEAATEPGLYYVPWAKLRTYAASGRWDIQSHSFDAHREQVTRGGERLPVLTSLHPDETEQEYARRVRTDVADAAHAIEQEVGVPAVAFAYPFGAHGGRYDARKNHPRASEHVRAAVGATSVVAFSQDDQSEWGVASPDDDPLNLRRLKVGNWTGERLVRRISRVAVGSKTDGRDEQASSRTAPRRTQAPRGDLRMAVQRTAALVTEGGDPRVARPVRVTRAVWGSAGDAVTGCQVSVGHVCLSYVTARSTARDKSAGSLARTPVPAPSLASLLESRDLPSPSRSTPPRALLPPPLPTPPGATQEPSATRPTGTPRRSASPSPTPAPTASPSPTQDKGKGGGNGPPSQPPGQDRGR